MVEKGEEKGEVVRVEDDPLVLELSNHAATVIQSTWRGVMTRSGVFDSSAMDAKVDDMMDGLEGDV